MKKSVCCFNVFYYSLFFTLFCLFAGGWVEDLTAWCFSLLFTCTYFCCFVFSLMLGVFIDFSVYFFLLDVLWFSYVFITAW